MSGSNGGDPTKNAQPILCPAKFLAMVVGRDDGALTYQIEAEITLPETDRPVCFLALIHQWATKALTEGIIESQPSVCRLCPYYEEGSECSGPGGK